MNNDYAIKTRDNVDFPKPLAYLEFLDVATNARMNEAEAAMYIATLYFCGLCKNGRNQEASDLLRIIYRNYDSETKRGAIAQERWNRFASAIKNARDAAEI